MLTGPVLEDFPVNPPHAFCPWLQGRDREWAMGTMTWQDARNFEGTIDEYLVSRNDNVPLIRAVQADDINEVRRLLELGAEVDAAGREGETALHMAAALGRAEIAGLLLDSHANISALTEENSTPLLHCARFCGSPNDSVRVANILLDHGADPTKGLEMECTPLFYALWRPLISLAERLIPLLDLSKRTLCNFDAELYAALDVLHKRQRIHSLNVYLQHASPYLRQRDILYCVEKCGLVALDAVLLRHPVIMGHSQSTWLHDHATLIAAATLRSPRLYRRPSTQTISVLERAYQYGCDPSGLVDLICEYEDPEVLKWAVENGVMLTKYSRGDLAEIIRYLPTGWQQTVLRAWDSQHSVGAEEQS